MKGQLPGAPTPEQIYEAYPRKVGRTAAIKAISRVIAGGGYSTGHLIERVNAFSAAVSNWPEHEKKYIPHPATWFNRGSYDDDPEAWVKTQSPAAGQRKMGFADQ